jgi:thioredoxin 1
MSTIADLTTDTFDASIADDTPVLVDFWAEWCAPCRAVAPVMKDIATDKGDQLRVAKLNVDENPDVAQKYGVMSIPTVILFSKGEEKARVVGARPKEQFLKEIDPHLV